MNEHCDIIIKVTHRCGHIVDHRVPSDHPRLDVMAGRARKKHKKICPACTERIHDEQHKLAVERKAQRKIEHEEMMEESQQARKEARAAADFVHRARLSEAMRGVPLKADADRVAYNAACFAAMQCECTIKVTYDGSVWRADAIMLGSVRISVHSKSHTAIMHKLGIHWYERRRAMGLDPRLPEKRDAHALPDDGDNDG